MANNIEWGHANYGGNLLSAEEVADLTQDQDETAGDVAVSVGSDGAMLLYGKPDEIEGFLTRVAAQLAEPLRKFRNEQAAQTRKDAGLPKCKHTWMVTEDGYSRCWGTRVDKKAKVITATFDGTSDFSEEGSGEYLQCTECAHVKLIPADYEVDWQ